jgi:hypothetical protein
MFMAKASALKDFAVWGSVLTSLMSGHYNFISGSSPRLTAAMTLG